MLTRSCGSWSTTTITSDPSSHELQDPEPPRVLAVSAQPHPAVAPAPHQLPRPPRAAGEHFIDDEIEAHAPADVRPRIAGPGQSQGDAIAPLRAPPTPAHAVWIARRVARDPHAEGPVLFRDNDVAARPAPPPLPRTPLPSQVELQAV